MSNPKLIVYEAKNRRGKALGWKFKMEADSGDAEYVSVGLFDEPAEAVRVATKVNDTMFHGELEVIVP